MKETINKAKDLAEYARSIGFVNAQVLYYDREYPEYRQLNIEDLLEEFDLGDEREIHLILSLTQDIGPVRAVKVCDDGDSEPVILLGL